MTELLDAPAGLYTESEFPTGNAPLLGEIRAALDAETDPVLRAYLVSIAVRLAVSEQFARYEFTRYLQEKAAPSGDWHWRWWAEVEAYRRNAQAAFDARWRITLQHHPEKAQWLLQLRSLVATTPAWAAQHWAAQQLDLIWCGIILG